MKPFPPNPPALLGAASISFHRHAMLLDPAGVAFLPRDKLMAVADLHLEKGSASATRGQLVPPWDSAVTLARLHTLVKNYRPQTLVCVGDSFHDTAGSLRLPAADRDTLAAIAVGTRLIWVRGNHDPMPPAGLPGETMDSFAHKDLIFRHEALRGASGEISGHFHPKACVVTRAAAITRPCFMTSTNRIILPSFGAYTGGLDIRNPAIATLFPDGGQAYVLGRDRVFCFAVSPASSDIVPCGDATPPLAAAGRAHRFA